MASRKPTTQREKRAKKIEENKILSKQQMKENAKCVCEKILHAIGLVEIVMGDVKHLKMGDERLNKELEFYSNKNLLPIFDDGCDKLTMSCTYDQFFIGPKDGSFVAFTEEEDFQEFGELCKNRKGIRLSIVAGKLFAEEYHSYHWEGSGNPQLWYDNFEPIGNYASINVLSCINDHKMFTVFCEWCKDNKFNLYDDLINSGKEWKKKME